MAWSITRPRPIIGAGTLCRVPRTPPATTILAAAAFHHLGAALPQPPQRLSPRSLPRPAPPSRRLQPVSRPLASLFRLLSAAVEGVGVWSAHMVMLFSLHRPNVLPFSNLGLRKRFQLLYGLWELPEPSEMERLCGRWLPYRSVGAWYMWRLAETYEGRCVAMTVNDSTFSLLPPPPACYHHIVSVCFIYIYIYIYINHEHVNRSCPK